MCLTRIYCLRTRDGVIFRFKSWAAMIAYSRENHETPKTLPIISRTEFIKWKRKKKNKQVELTWVDSIRIPGMSILREYAS